MFRINYEHSSYCDLIKDCAATMEVPVKKNFLKIPPHIGDGYFKYFMLSNSLQCLLTEMKLNQAIYQYQNSSDKEEFFTLRFYESAGADNLLVKIDKAYVWEGRRQSASVFLTSSLYDFGCMIPKEAKVKTITVLFPGEWLLKYLAAHNIKKGLTVLKNHLTLKTGSCNFVPFDEEYKKLFNEIMTVSLKA